MLALMTLDRAITDKATPDRLLSVAETQLVMARRPANSGTAALRLRAQASHLRALAAELAA